MEVAHNFVYVGAPGGTRLDQQIDVHPEGLLRVSAPLTALTLKRSIQANTAALNAYLKRGANVDAARALGSQAERRARGAGPGDRQTD
jgi:hypothetical protein